MTIDTPEKIYEHIAAALTACVDGEWSEIQLYVNIDGDAVGLDGSYRATTGETYDLDIPEMDYSVAKALKTLNTLMASTEHDAWKDAVLTLHADGHFDMSFK